ncbi:sex-lethal homolog isoform X2 [Contarinia nasturtii]|uniref:sex-lethal homolog isoform X2 n=1 Tax=Contarinia nasturtii TaxID=265458 RepID=UPI0012D3E757|nr:sex-lethal homolog isoform X2 [Contarinia nasturtii]
MYNKLNGYTPFRSSSGRMWGMSHSMPTGMSLYADHFTPSHTSFTSQSLCDYQDTDFSSQYLSRHRFDYPSSSSSFGAGAYMSTSSSHSLGIGGNADTAGTNLIVNYLPQDMTDRELYSLFRHSGPIESCRVMRDFKTNYSFGYGFVNFVSEKGARQAIKTLNGITLRNKRLKVSFARPSGEDIKDTNLYVTNLPRTVNEDLIETIFGKYGNIVQKNILKDKISGKPRGVAFVRFNKREEAQEAISALNNVIPEGSSQPLTVRIAEEHGKQKANLFYGGQSMSPMNMMNNYMNFNQVPSSNVMRGGRARYRFQNMCPY